MEKQAIHAESIWGRMLAACKQWGIGTVLVVSGLLRLGSILLLHFFTNPETWEYGPLARSVAAGFGYSDVLDNGIRVPAVFLPPAYAYIMGVFYWIGGASAGSYLALEILQAGFGVLLVYVVYRLAWMLLGQQGAIAAAWITALYPTQVYLCNEFNGISFYLVLGTGAVFFLVRYLTVCSSWKSLFAASLCMGAMMYFRAEATAIIFIHAAIFLMLGGWKRIGPAVVFVLVAFACLAPWMIRNYREFGRIIPVNAEAGYVLWVGNNANATGGQHYDYFGLMSAEEKSGLQKIPQDKFNRVRVDDYLKGLAFEYIRSHPRQEVGLAFKKLFLFFLYDPDHAKGRSPLYWLPSVFLTVFALWGAVLRGRKLMREDLFLVASVLFAVAVGVVVYVLPRYKIVIDPFLIILAAAVFADKSVWRQARSRIGEKEGTALPEPMQLA